MRFVAGRGAVAELLAVSAMAKRMAAPWLRAIGKLLLARGTVAESHREAFAGQGCCSGAPSGSSHCRKGMKSHCWKGEPLLEMRATAGKVRRATAGKEMSAAAGEKGLQRSNGWVSFFDAPLMQIIPIFVVW